MATTPAAVSPTKLSRSGSSKGHRTTEVVDWSTADDAFKRFFRIPAGAPLEGVHHLDSLSRLACGRQGVLPHELLPVAPATLLARAHISASASEKILAAVSEKEKKRRDAKFDIVEQERRQLHDVIISAAHATRLTHEQNKIRSELLAQSEEGDGELRCADDDETEDIRLLIHHSHSLAPEREKLQKIVEQTRTKGAEEVRKLRRRHLHMVAHDMNLEAQRREILTTIEERDAVFQSMKAHREQQLAEQARREARLHRRKIRELHLRNAVIAEHRAAELTDRTAAQEELWQQLVKERQTDLERRREESKRKDEIARQRADAVRLANLRECEDLERQLLDKAVTHDERRETIKLQLEVAREQRRVLSLRKFYAAKQFVESSADDGSDVAKEVEQRTTSASRRRDILNRQRQEEIKKRQEERDAQLRAIEERRRAASEAKARRDLEILQHEYEMEQLVEEARRQKAEERQLLVAVEVVKKTHHTDNLARIERQQQHKQQQREAQLLEARARDQAKTALRIEMAKKVQAARQRLAEDRERVQQQVVKLRNAKDMHNQSPTDVLEASLKRDRPATSPARSQPRRVLAAAPSAAAQTPPPAAATPVAREAQEPRPATSPSVAVREAAASRGHSA